MCGICGYLWNSEGREIDRATFDRMTDSLAHRGPDDRGVYYRRKGEIRPESPGVAYFSLLIEATGVDTGGHNTHAVYSYCRAHAHAQVLALKGASQYGKPIISKPSNIDINWRGLSDKRGVHIHHLPLED